jgi:hypothetical protein
VDALGEDNRLAEVFLNQMTIDPQTILGRVARCSWLRLVITIDPQTVWGTLACCFWLSLAMGAMGLLVVVPGLAWALGEDAAACWTSNANPPAHQALREGKEHFTTGDSGLWLVPCQFAPTFGSDSADGYASDVAQSSSTNSPDLSPTYDQRQRLNVNPVTGLAVAAEPSYRPLTGKERWKLYFKMTYASAGPYLSPVMTALLLDEANGTPRQWGGGFPGFGRRLASRAGNAVLEGTFQAPLAALLHEDVRYIPTTQRSFQRRAFHAVLYSFLTYNDKGHPTLNIANLIAYYASTAVTTAWLPGTQNAARYTFINASEQIALSFPLNVVQEFWPEIRRHVFRRH